MIVIGGGAAGMMAAILLGRMGQEVTLFEHNEKLGKKLYITGKGRCNLTNACASQDFLGNVKGNPKFLYSAFAGFDNEKTMGFFREAGLSLKVERGNRVFPSSDKSSDVLGTLERELKKAGVTVRLRTEVKEILVSEGKAVGVRLQDGQEILGDAVLVATGGLSYPTTGSTGDGYRFARELGHTVTDLMPSLVPFRCREGYVADMAGLSLKNVRLTIKKGKKVLFEDFGEMMFTHEGITGPLVLSASAIVGKELKKQGELLAWIDLKPALSEEQLDERILREFSGTLNRQFKNVIGVLFPASLTPVMLRIGSIPPEKTIHEVTKGERLEFVYLVKHFPLTLTGLAGFSEAVVTKGGVKVSEVDPGTMMSKKVPGLFFAGEVLDADAVTGGFNLQIAWSTGAAAARGMAEYVGGAD